MLAGVLLIAWIQLQAPPATPHPRPAKQVVLEQTGVCGGKAYRLVLSAGAPVRVETFSIDGVVWSAEELARWNRELDAIREEPVVRFACTSRGDAVRIAGNGSDANYVAVTASGGKGRWFGFTRERFLRTLEPEGVELKP